MTQFALISQPVKFRTNPTIAEWTYVPRLHALFGIGPGLRETLQPETLHAIRNVFLLDNDLDACSPPVETLFTESRNYYQLETPIREHAPPYVVETTDGERQYRMTEDAAGDFTLVPAAKMKPRTLTALPGYVVGATKREDGAPQFTLYRRTAALKPQYQTKVDQPSYDAWIRGFRRDHVAERLADLRRVHKAHLDYHTAIIAMSQPEMQTKARKVAEVAAAAHMMHRKAPQPKQPAKKRPAIAAPIEPLPESIKVTISEIARGLITMRRRRSTKLPNDLVLLEHALRKIAIREVEAMLHDFTLQPVATFTENGLEFAESEPLQHPISVTP